MTGLRMESLRFPSAAIHVSEVTHELQCFCRFSDTDFHVFIHAFLTSFRLVAFDVVDDHDSSFGTVVRRDSHVSQRSPPYVFDLTFAAQ